MKLTPAWLLRNGFLLKEGIFENIVLPYYCRNSVCLFFNGSPPENTFLLGYGFVFDGKYYCATFQWIDTVEPLEVAYPILTGKNL